MRTAERKILVYADWFPEGARQMGTLYASTVRGSEVFAFEYTDDWLESGSLQLDPELQLYDGRQYTPVDKRIWGIFADSSPDRWGRLLMRRREALRARKAAEKPKKLLESDYLLGVYDAARMGALRFKTEEDGEFLSAESGLATPPWTTLRSLEAASLAFENDEAGTEEKWLKQLLAPGSSLGGARPKATVQDVNGDLWIAKFPSKHDEWDSGAWEMVVHDLAELCGLQVPEARLERFSSKGSTFLVKRFDRKNGRRIHFSSAMTLLGKTDGASGTDGSSYLELADFIRAYGASPEKDLEELWKRLVFSIAVSNTDDHLRNHGFLLEGQGWRLSPVYDVNPDIYGDQLSLNICEDDASLSFAPALRSAEYYGLSQEKAKEKLEEIRDKVDGNWRGLSARYGIGRSAMEYMEPAFNMDLKK